MSSFTVKICTIMFSVAFCCQAMAAEDSRYLRLMEKEKQYKQLLQRSNKICSRIWARIYERKPLPSPQACSKALQAVQKQMQDIEKGYNVDKSTFASGIQTANLRYYPLIRTTVKAQASKQAKQHYSTDPRIHMQTTQWWKTPIKLSGPNTVNVEIGDQEQCYLAGDKLGTQPWEIDNFLLFELRAPQQDPTYFAVGVILDTIEIQTRTGLKEVKDVVKTGSKIQANTVELSKFFPKNIGFSLTVTALDYGGVAILSNVYLVCK